MPGSVSAGIGQAIFVVILIVQTILIVILAPALTSGAISMEREKQTLELLITTPVSTLGMVSGKLISSHGLRAAADPRLDPAHECGVRLRRRGAGGRDQGVHRALRDRLRLWRRSVSSCPRCIKRTQMATAAVVPGRAPAGRSDRRFCTSWWYSSSGTSSTKTTSHAANQSAPDMIVWLNPFAADADLMCTAVPDPFGGTCSYTGILTGIEIDPSNPPRDAYWPRSVAAHDLVGHRVAAALHTADRPLATLATSSAAADRRQESIQPNVRLPRTIDRTLTKFRRRP